MRQPKEITACLRQKSRHTTYDLEPCKQHITGEQLKYLIMEKYVEMNDQCISHSEN